MPKFRITAPDGKSYEVNAPEGATQDQVLAYAQAHYQQPDAAPKEWQPTRRSPADIQAMAGKRDATEGMSFPAQYAAGWGKSYHDAYNGLRQIGAGGMDMLDGGNRSAAVQEDVDTAARVDASLAGSPGGKGGRYSGLIVQGVTPMTNAGKLVTYAGRGASALKGAVGGAVTMGIQPTVTGESRAANTATGGVLGGFGGAIAPALAAGGNKLLNMVAPEVKALYQAAQARGITLTPAQLSDSRFLKQAASMLQSLPGSGAKRAAEAQKAAFNQQVAKEVGSTAPVLNPAEYANVKALQSRQFEAITARNQMKVTPEVLAKLHGAEKAASISPEAQAAVRAAIDRFAEQVETGPSGVVLSGKAYQALDSELGQITKRGDVNAHFVGQVKQALRDAMDKSISPKDKAAWDLLRKQYGNRKTVRDLVAKAEDGSGISPAQLMGRVTATNSGKEAMATNRGGGLGDLARIGQRMKEPPSSGTAERILAANALNPLAWPIMAGRAVVGSTMGRLANSPNASRVMLSQAPGNTLNGLARLVEKTRPQVTLPAAAIALPAQAQAKKKKKP